ncbi:Nif3-like dinuclear metal center hexameric protein [Candidatus Hydrogenedentota bacterium]
MSDNMMILTDDNFESTISGNELPLVVDFWAVWCPPCKMLTPILEDLAAEYDGRISVVKVNVDECRDTARKLDIQSIPTLHFYKNGELAEEIVGLRPKDALKESFDALLCLEAGEPESTKRAQGELMARVGDVADLLRELAPESQAFDYDNVGLLVGDENWPADHVMVALDPDYASVKQAAKAGVGLLVSHHPLFISPIRHVRTSSEPGKTIALALEHKIAIYCSHTNLDVAPHGTGEVLANHIGLTNVQSIPIPGAGALVKICVFVPVGHEDAVRSAMYKAGAGVIGLYEECSFMTPGTGTFRPVEGADPFEGKIGDLSRVDEFKLEVVVAKSRSSRVIAAMMAAHPYEEVAYDVYPLDNTDPAYSPLRVGILKKPIKLKTFAKRLKRLLKVDRVRVTGDLESAVSVVGVCGGSGGELIREEILRDVDVLVTGDIKYHQFTKAGELGGAVIDAGHRGTELPVVAHIASYLRARCKQAGHKVSVKEADAGPDPVQSI